MTDRFALQGQNRHPGRGGDRKGEISHNAYRSFNLRIFFHVQALEEYLTKILRLSTSRLVNELSYPI